VAFGLKFSDGGAHISRTIMLAELEALLEAVPVGSDVSTYRAAVLTENVLGKTTASTRDKSLRHLRELYALDEATPIFAALRRLAQMDATSLPALALQVAWARDPLLRSTTPAVLGAREGAVVEPATLSEAIHTAFGEQYSQLNRDKIARNAGSSWTQSGHLIGRTKKTRRRIQPSAAAVALALFLGDATGYHGTEVFANPWCQLLDLDADRARAMAGTAHRAGFLTLRAVGDVIDLTFPLFADLQLSMT
jgi:hypothetical protein